MILETPVDHGISLHPGGEFRQRHGVRNMIVKDVKLSQEVEKKVKTVQGPCDDI